MVQDLGVYKLKTGPSYKLKTGPSFFWLFFPSCIVFWGIFRNTNSATNVSNLCFCIILGMSKMRFSKRKLHFLFFLFYVGDIETEKKQKKENGKGQKTL